MLVEVEIERALDTMHGTDESPDVWMVRVEVALKAIMRRLHVVVGAVIAIGETPVQLPHGMRVAWLGTNDFVLQLSTASHSHRLALS